MIFDPMVIVDLGGMGPLDLPNPNVMYELGIRHALDRAVVLLAWEGQRLPFDISNQRALISERGLIDVDPTRRRLKIFIQAAAAGRFYRPMQAVVRGATLDHAAEKLPQESLARALIAELRELRLAVNASTKTPATKAKKKKKGKALGTIIDKSRKPSLKESFLASGGSDQGWASLMASDSSEYSSDPSKWAHKEWDQAFEEFR